MRILDLGCGSNRREGAVGVDITRGSAADVIADLDRSFYPFRDNTFDRIVYNQVIEHLTDVPRAFEEVWRLAAPGAFLEGATPHFSSSASYSDPTHRHHFGIRTFDFLASQSQKPVGKIRRFLGLFYRAGELEHRPAVAQKFEKVEVRLAFNPLLRKVGIEWVANLYPELYEAFFAFIFPARDIVFWLKVIK